MKAKEKLQEQESRKVEKNVEHFEQIASADINLTPIDSSVFVSSEADKNQPLL